MNWANTSFIAFILHNDNIGNFRLNFKFVALILRQFFQIYLILKIYDYFSISAFYRLLIFGGFFYFGSSVHFADFYKNLAFFCLNIAIFRFWRSFLVFIKNLFVVQ